MSASIKAQTFSTIVKGDFEKAEVAKGFSAPILDLIKCGVSKVVLHFGLNGDTYIKCINDERNCICDLKYNKDFSNFITTTEDYSLGIYELNEFIRMFNIISNDGCQIEINERNETLVNSGISTFNFIGCEPDTIKEGPKSLSATVSWLAEFKWSSKQMEVFIKALSTLSQNYVKFEGVSGDNSIKMTVWDKDVKTSTFTHIVDIEDELESDFKIILNKEVLQSVVVGSIKDLTFQLSEEVILVFGNSDYHNIKYYLAPVEQV